MNPKETLASRKLAFGLGIGLLVSLALLVQPAGGADLALGLAVNGYEDFEAGEGDFIPDNGVWEIGIPIAGPPYVYQGEAAAGTILAGTYPGYQDSRLITPVVALPAAAGAEQVQLRFWQWFSYSSYDSGTVQIAVYDVETDTWGDWTNLATVREESAVWSPINVDLTRYAGKYVQIGFLHVADRNVYGHASESTGWYIDEVRIWKDTPRFVTPEGGELGWGDWYVENGVWEVGEPNSGPVEAYEGKAVFGTVLGGNYPGYTDSRLVSPPFTLPELPGLSPLETLELRFRHWFSYSSYDSGTVQVSVYDPATDQWGGWENLAGVSGDSGVWTPLRVPLTEYAGRRIRVAFLHAAGRNVYGHKSESSGWYIDEVQIPATDEVVIYDVPLDSDPGWDRDGQWEYGVPTGLGGKDYGNPDPTSGYTGQHVLGVNLNGDYAVAAGERYSLLAGPFDLTGFKDVTLEYARYLNTDEPGYVDDAVELSIDGGQTWHTVWQHADGGSITDATWTLVRHALGPVADGQPTVYLRWSYQVLDRRAYESSGWNIDDIKLVGTAQ